MITLSSLSKLKPLENKISYETELGLSLEKRSRLLDIIRGDNSFSDKQAGLYFTNLHAHHTEWHMHTQHSEFKELTDLVDNYVATSILPIPLAYRTAECWGGIYDKDDFAKLHHHQPHTWAWCYYPFAPEGSAPLRFHDPIVNTLKDIDDSFVYEVQPKDDLLVLFSGNRYHSVPKSKTNFERVVVAGNIYLSGDTKY